MCLGIRVPLDLQQKHKHGFYQQAGKWGHLIQPLVHNVMVRLLLLGVFSLVA
jgi:hypothetical protein